MKAAATASVRTFAELADEVCAGAGLPSYELRSRDVTFALKEYVSRAAGVHVRARGNRYTTTLELRPAAACTCEHRDCGHKKVAFKAAEWTRLREVLGEHCVPERACDRTWLFARLWDRSPPSSADLTPSPVLVPPEHQDLVRALLRQACNRVRPGAYPTDPANPLPTWTSKEARAWLRAQANELRAAAAVLGRGAVLQVLDGARPRRGR